MVCYAILWFEMYAMLWYFYAMPRDVYICDAMSYVVKDKHNATENRDLEFYQSTP